VWCRYHHASVCLPARHSLLVYGGVTENSAVSDELWMFSLLSSHWTRLMVSAQHRVVSLCEVVQSTVWFVM